MDDGHLQIYGHMAADAASEISREMGFVGLALGLVKNR
jgi:hypothetical protein